jgi:hypothetical protein
MVHSAPFHPNREAGKIAMENEAPLGPRFRSTQEPPGGLAALCLHSDRGLFLSGGNQLQALSSACHLFSCPTQNHASCRRRCRPSPAPLRWPAPAYCYTGVCRQGASKPVSHMSRTITILKRFLASLNWFARSRRCFLLGLKHPLRNLLPCLAERLIQDFVAWLKGSDQAPEFVSVVHVDGMAEFVNEDVAHQIRRKE